MEPNKIVCPNCGTPINVSDVLFHQVQETLKQDFEAQTAKKDKEFKEKAQQLEQEKEKLAKAQESLQEKVDAAVKEKMSVEKGVLEKTLRKQLTDDTAGQIKLLEDELKQKSDQVKELNSMKALVSKLQRDKEELKGAIETELSLKFEEQLALEKGKIQTTEAEKNKLDVQKKDKLISDLTKKLEEATLRLELGSNKEIGEIAELELREFLKAEYPIDDISDIASGARGADVLQLVKNNIGSPSGTILYERKQTLKFDDKWVSKVKDDARRVKSDVCVILTKSMPKDNNETHFRDGVWICALDDIKILSALLRDGLIKQSAALVSQQNKGDKMTMLYDYLLSNDFKNHILGILDAFKKMDKAVVKEKEDSLKRMVEREAHIWQAKQSILSFWGRVSGIAESGLTQQMMALEEPTKEREE
jgi:hypothetical protein